MGPVALFRLFGRRDKLRLILAILLLGGVTLALRLFSYRALASRLPRGTAEPSPTIARRTALMVLAAARLVPGATCLPKAVTGQLLLGLRGYRSTIRIGVAEAGGAFQAHAWLLVGDQPIIGGSADEVSRYAVLTDLALPSA